MHRHLISIEISIESSTNHRMNLNSFSFNQYWLKSLDRQAMQSWRTIEKHVVMLNNFIQNFICFFSFSIHHSSSSSNIMCKFFFNKLIDNKRFEKFQSHLLRQTSLMKFKLRSNHNHRSSRIIHAFSKQVLTETSLFSFESISQ